MTPKTEIIKNGIPKRAIVSINPISPPFGIPKLPENTISTAHKNYVGADLSISKPLIIEG